MLENALVKMAKSQRIDNVTFSQTLFSFSFSPSRLLLFFLFAFCSKSLSNIIFASQNANHEMDGCIALRYPPVYP